jgi:eukaryotic-like serine/threonine-protein kinase
MAQPREEADLSVTEWTVPGYTTLKPLGEGGFGAVVLARHDATGTRVAVKYLRAALLDDPGLLTMFRAEADVLGELDNPHVVRLYEYVESPDGAAIVMELVDGASLAQILARQGKTTPEAALVVLFGSLLGLAAAHERGLVHRDFKPANVLVNAGGASKLTDFGIAARAGSTPVPAGSLRYAPPEQFAGAPASPAGDVYAAMATYYQCLTGQPPFPGPSQAQLLHQHANVEVPLDPVPEALRPLVARGLAKDPAGRPADAVVLAAELREAAIGAYGEDWEEQGRSHLGEAALLLAALWPTAAATSAQETSSLLTQLTRGLVQSARHPSRLLHLGALATAGAIAAATAVVAAGATVAATGSTAPSDVSLRPATAYQASLITVPVSATAKTISGQTAVTYHGGKDATAQITGTITGAAKGDIVQLYAEPFPYTGQPAIAGSASLTPAGGAGTYRFTVTPSIATRYQVKVLSRTSPAPLAVSPVKTIYVIKYFDSSATIDCSGKTCQVKAAFAIHVPVSSLRTEMSKPLVTYFAYAYSSKVPAVMRLGAGSPVATAPQKTAPDVFRISVTFTYPDNDQDNDTAAAAQVCSKDSEPADGVGLPGTHGCGGASISGSPPYIG